MDMLPDPSIDCPFTVFKPFSLTNLLSFSRSLVLDGILVSPSITLVGRAATFAKSSLILAVV